MHEMQQVAASEVQGAQAAPTPPATPTPAAPIQPAQGTPAIAGAPTGLIGTSDLSKFSLQDLRQMHSELYNQRADFARRREATAETYEGATGANREGMGERLRLLDNNIMLYERELARVGNAIAGRSGESIQRQPGDIPPGMVDEDDAILMSFGFSMATALLTVFIARRFFRRRYAGVSAGRQPTSVGSSERLDRIENAVDSIAVEIERVSENQRFMTRLMTEAQLGDTIKDVRKSTELAKSAAERDGS